MTQLNDTNIPSFSTRFSPHEHLSLVRYWDYSGGYGARSSAAEAECSAMMDALEAALVGHLSSLRASNLLTSIPDVEGRGLTWPDRWNAFVAGHEIGDGIPRVEFLRPFMSEIMPRYISQIPRQKVADPQERYEDMIDAIDKGTLHVEYRLDQDCGLTGVRPFVLMAPGWNITPHVEKASIIKTYPRKFEALGPPPTVELIELRIPVPSGRLMVADWFRMPNHEFSALTREGAPHNDINTPLGRTLLTKFYAERYGVLSISVGDMSPTLIREGKHMVLGHFDEHHPSQRWDSKLRLAKVDTNLWWATIVDVEVFTTLLKSHMGEEEGTRAADEYLLKGECSFIEVAPGEMFAYLPSMDGCMKEFECESEEVGMVGVQDLFAVLSGNQLSWRNFADEKPTAVDRPRGG